MSGEDPGIDLEYLRKLREEDDRREAEALNRAQGIQARLLKRLRFRVVPVKFSDGNEDFEIIVRLPSPELRRRIYEIRAELLTASPERIDEINVELAHILEKICVDKSLNAEFWLGGEGFDVKVPERLLNVAMGFEVPDREAAEFFRKDPGGSASS